jgi:signal transduction histidine kinase
VTRPRRGWWFAFAACAAAVLAALGWVTRDLLALERSEAGARASARHHDAVRLALWRMDSWLAPLLAQEAARPAADFAWTPDVGRLLSRPNPLSEYDSPWFRLHFQLGPEGPPTSPQVFVADPVACAANASVLLDVGRVVDYADLRARVVAAEPTAAAHASVHATAPPATTLHADTVSPAPSSSVQQLAPQREPEELQAEYGKRQRSVAPARAQANIGQPFNLSDHLARPQLSVAGPLVPVWLSDAGVDVGQRHGADPSRLVFARRAHPAMRASDSFSPPPGDDLLQGFVADWPRLSRELLALVDDVLPSASLRPLALPGLDAGGMALATVPAALDPGPAPAVAIPLASPARLTLGVAWLAVLVALGAAGFTLRSSIEFGERRSRFASSVTHELRTPLTTFRLYSEMLAEGMVEDPAQRQLYLDTLKAESARLATLVENVLAYARVEEGRAPRARERVKLSDLLARVLPPLERRAAESGVALSVDLGRLAQAQVEVHVDSVGQVLFNLVDNACKYGAESADRRVDLTVHAADAPGSGPGAVELRLRDRGPGIPPERVRAAFTPFERGGRPPGDAVPGLGLGLALSRALARDQSGELSVRSPDDGPCACLVLSLPGVA